METCTRRSSISRAYILHATICVVPCGEQIAFLSLSSSRREGARPATLCPHHLERHAVTDSVSFLEVKTCVTSL